MSPKLTNIIKVGFFLLIKVDVAWYLSTLSSFLWTENSEMHRYFNYINNKYPSIAYK